jgi:hypothetical protein
MSTHRDKMWLAYLDGELSASEAAEFDQLLTPADKERLTAEVRFERALGEALAGEVSCPDALWRKTIIAVNQRDQVLNAPGTPKWMYAVTAVAAALAITTAAVLYRVAQQPRSVFVMPAGFPSEMAANAEIAGTAPLEEINRYLAEHGFKIAMTTTDMEGPRAHHSREFLGLHSARNRGEPVVEFYFECCGKPIKMIVAPKGGATDDEMRRRLAAREIQASRPVGDYVAAVVGRHKAHGFLDLIEATQEQVARRGA